jgi:hypothetical protein
MAKVSNDMKCSSTLINEENDPFFDRKIENATEGLLPAMIIRYFQAFA